MRLRCCSLLDNQLVYSDLWHAQALWQPAVQALQRNAGNASVAHKVHLARITGRGNGVVAQDNIPSGTAVLTIPIRAMVSTAVVDASALAPAVRAIDGLGLGKWTRHVQMSFYVAYAAHRLRTASCLCQFP